MAVNSRILQLDEGTMIDIERLLRSVCYFLRDFGLYANVAMGLFVITRIQIYQKGNESLLTNGFNT